MPNPLIPVSQDAREAAAKMVLSEWGSDDPAAEKVAWLFRNGHDDESALLQAFARFESLILSRTIEEAAAIADDEAEGRHVQQSNANAMNDKRMARDFESMAIEATQLAAAIRALAPQPAAPET